VLFLQLTIYFVKVLNSYAHIVKVQWKLLNMITLGQRTIRGYLTLSVITLRSFHSITLLDDLTKVEVRLGHADLLNDWSFGAKIDRIISHPDYKRVKSKSFTISLNNLPVRTVENVAT
jgi:hypothetical protein